MNWNEKHSSEKFCKKGASVFFAKSTVKHLNWSLFLIKLQAWWCTTLLERKSGKSVFLCVFQNFWKNLFCRTYSSGKLTEMNQKRNCVSSIHKKTPVKTSFLVQFQTCGLTAFSKGLLHRCFSTKIVKFYRKLFFQNSAMRLLLISCNIVNKTKKTSSVVIFGGWDWLGKQKDIL